MKNRTRSSSTTSKIARFGSSRPTTTTHISLPTRRRAIPPMNINPLSSARFTAIPTVTMIRDLLHLSGGRSGLEVIDMLTSLRHHKVVQAQLKRPMVQLSKSHALQHFSHFTDRQPLLMLVAFHFVADQMESVHHVEDRIYQRRRPGHDQRTTRQEDPTGLTQNR